jgi:hypothetical protein
MLQSFRHGSSGQLVPRRCPDPPPATCTQADHKSDHQDTQGPIGYSDTSQNSHPSDLEARWWLARSTAVWIRARTSCRTLLASAQARSGRFEGPFPSVRVQRRVGGGAALACSGSDRAGAPMNPTSPPPMKARPGTASNSVSCLVTSVGGCSALIQIKRSADRREFPWQSMGPA